MSYYIEHCTVKEEVGMIAIVPDADYTIRIKNGDDYSYVDGSLFVPNNSIDDVLPRVDAIPTKDVPPEPVPPEPDAEYDIKDDGVSTEPTPQVESVSVKDLAKDYKNGRVTKEEIKNYVKQGLIFVSDYVTITGEEYTE